MKWLIWIMFLLCGLTSLATNYYVGAGGFNTNNGLTINTRWLNVTKVNSFTFASGDSILFAANESFFGMLEPRSNSVVIASYGTGKATLTALSTLTGWTNVSGNIWQCTPSVTLPANCNVLTINGYPQAVGRYPNVNQYLIYQTANNTTLTSNALTGFQNVVGAEVCFKNNGYSATKGKITAQSGTVLTYAQTQPIDNGSAVASNPVMPSGGNFGFFMQRFAASLDVQGEWFFNQSTNKVQIYSTVNPSTYTIKASYLDTVIKLANHTNITIHNITVEGGGLYGVESFLGANITIKNCTFINNTRAIYAWGPLNMVVDNNTIRHSFNNAIMINGSSNRYPKQISITNNTIDSTGELLGMGLYWSDFNLKGMYARVDVSTTANFCNIIGNTLRHTGYSGIQFQGSNVTVRRNIIDSFLGNLQDGGAIYSFTNNLTLNTINYVNRLVDSNFSSNALNGAWRVGNDMSPDVAGLYADDQATNITFLHNTTWNIPANPNDVAGGGTGVSLQMNTPHDNIFRDNTIYNCHYFMDLNKRHAAEVYNNVVKKNIMYQKQNTLQLYFFHVDENLTQPTPHTITAGIQNIAVIDSNWISNQLPNAFKYYYSANGSGTTGPILFNLSAWRATYLHDVNAVLPPITLTNTNTNLYTNPSNNLMVVGFSGFRKIDPKGVIYDNQATVGRWSSLILIDDGNSPSGGNVPPTINAGVDKTIVSPTSTTSVTATSTLGSGSSIGYLWSELSGPNAATNSAPTSATTTFGNLIVGTYQMKVRGLNNLGDSAVDFMQITVNAANQPPVAIISANPTVQLPTNSTTLSGNASYDPEGGTLVYAWLKISGPSGGTVVNPSSAITSILNMVAGIYTFSLQVTDQGGLTNTAFVTITVYAIVPPPNQPPVAIAGPDQVIGLPVSTAAVDASDSYDPEGGAITFSWKKTSGPSGGAITNTTMAATCVSGLVQGVYIYQVTVKDAQGDSSVSSLKITVNGANQNPTVFAGNDTSITLPSNSVVLNAIGTDPEGDNVTYDWIKLAGPVGGTITIPNGQSTSVTSLGVGVYIFQVTVTDSLGNTGTDAVQVTVNPAPVLVPPVADAGIGQTITTPASSTTLNGSATDADGTIVSFGWVQVSGPNSAVLTPNNTASIVVSNLIAGTYKFKLTATDNDGLTGVDTVQVDVVNPVNTPPVASAGGNFTTSATSVTLNGSGSDIGGNITAYSWTIVSQPLGSAAVITSPTSATTTVTNLVVGVYQFQLTVTDNGSLTASDTATITITSPASSSFLLRFYKIFP